MSQIKITSDAKLILNQITRSVGLGSVLDFGCTDINVLQQFWEYGYDAQGVAIQSDVFSSFQENYKKHIKLVNGNKLPYNDKSFDIVTCINVLEFLPKEQVLFYLNEIRRVTRHGLLLHVNSSLISQNILENRDWWEQLCIETGFRKHPNAFNVTSYDALETESNKFSILFEPVPESALAYYPLAALKEERDLHMDMGREAGRRSDAHMVRYYESAKYIRSGDRVLDAACGLGYGSSILKHNSLCSSVHGIDGSDYAIKYAQKNYGQEGKVSFSKGFLPECLTEFEHGSFDFIASFETLEHLENPLRFLEACKRVLSPGGRILVSVPHDWTEEDGKDPNPYHFHVYDWESLQQQVKESFHVEKAFAQTASRLKRNGEWAAHGREWKEIEPSRSIGVESEWCLILATKDPLSSDVPYFDRHNQHDVNVSVPTTFDFANQYENPWLVTSLISIGMRTENKPLLLDIAKRTVSKYRGVDAAAAYCVQGYKLLSDNNSLTDIEAWKKNIEVFISDRDWSLSKEIDIRWAISLLSILSLINRKYGNIDEEKDNLLSIINIPFLSYSPLIATKVVDARFKLGLFYWKRNDVNSAHSHFLEGLKSAEAAVCVNWTDVFGNIENLPRFVTNELSQILDISTRCSVALKFVRNEKPQGKVFLETIWNNAYEINLLHENIKHLSLVNQQYEKTKNDWYEPRIKHLEALKEINSTESIKNIDDSIDGDTSHLRRRMMHHVEMVRRLVTNIKQLEKQLDEANNLRTSWYEPQLAHLNNAIAEYETAKQEWFIPQLAARESEVAHLQNHISSMQAQIDEVTAFRRGRSFRIWRRLHPTVWRIRNFLRLN